MALRMNENAGRKDAESPASPEEQIVTKGLIQFRLPKHLCVSNHGA